MRLSSWMHPLPCPKQRAHCEAGCLYSPWYRHERLKEPRSGGHPDRLRGWAFRFSPGNKSRIPADGNPVVHHPPDPELHEICIL